MSRTGLAAVLALCVPASGLAQTVDELVARNVAARGGAAAWRAVSTLRLAGRVDVGQGMLVPYVLEQKRPHKMRLELVFDGQTAVQCSDGKAGWKVEPFRGRTTPVPLTVDELAEGTGPSDIDGLLFDHARRGLSVELVGREKVQERDAVRLKVTLPGGAIRWVSLDAETALELKVEARRRLVGRERRVETFYQDWQATDGLLIPRRLETRAEGALHLLTVESVRVNSPIDDARFARPAAEGKSGPAERRTR
jgi:hypothetical protein